ncbi:MAG: hypothetical protein FWD17_06765 [Polyangiaceae bacterium]|nr:hypothetical protein [Polyangiaceae bacterium]
MKQSGLAEAERYLTDEARWSAVCRRDPSADGKFCYAVRTTGVYCRPSCPARLARRDNVSFHASPASADRAGFRACRRCKPLEAPPEREANAVSKRRRS